MVDRATRQRAYPSANGYYIQFVGFSPLGVISVGFGARLTCPLFAASRTCQTSSKVAHVPEPEVAASLDWLMTASRRAAVGLPQ
jgi:hypothetical protein